VIKRMEIVSSQPGVPVLPLGGFVLTDDPVQIRNIEGLGPVKAEVSSTPFSTGRGSLYQGDSIGTRNIILTLGLNPNWIDQTMMSLRQLLYRYFMPQTWSKLRFITDELPIVYINGVVESFEPNHFAQDPEIQISLLCPKPDFIDVDSTLIHGVSSAIGTIADPSSALLIDYIGTVPTGFEIHLHASEEVPTFDGEVIITNQIGNQYQDLRVVSVNLNAAEYLKVNTSRTTRQIYYVIVASDEEVNILGQMDKDATWPEFNPGPNQLRVLSADPGLDWTLGYFNRFGGL
jgi:hypothetical protein